MVQNTTAETACWLAKNWIRAIRALKMNTMAMPSSTMVSIVTPRRRLSR